MRGTAIVARQNCCGLEKIRGARPKAVEGLWSPVGGDALLQSIAAILERLQDMEGGVLELFGAAQRVGDGLTAPMDVTVPVCAVRLEFSGAGESFPVHWLLWGSDSWFRCPVLRARAYFSDITIRLRQRPSGTKGFQQGAVRNEGR